MYVYVYIFTYVFAIDQHFNADLYSLCITCIAMFFVSRKVEEDIVQAHPSSLMHIPVIPVFKSFFIKLSPVLLM